jgi:hypothetical protein
MSEGFAISSRNDKHPRLKKTYIWLAWIIIMAVAVIPRVTDLDVFYARDELAIWPWADEFAIAIREGNLAGTLTPSNYPGIPMFWVQTIFLGVKYTFPSFFQQTMIPFEMIAKDHSLNLLAERRLAAGLFIGVQIVIAIWLVRRLFGWQVALLSAIFIGLDPFSLTEARLLRLEMMSAGFVCLSLLSYLLYLRRRRWKWVLLSGLMAGLGVSSKTSAGLIVPYVWFLLLFDFLLAERLFESGLNQTWLQKFKQMVTNGLVWAAGAITAFWLVWPAMWVKPLEAIRYIFLWGFAQAAERSVWGDSVFFWGQIIKGGDPGPLFYPVVLAFRTTPLAWIGLIITLLFLGRVFYLHFKAKSAGPASETQNPKPGLSQVHFDDQRQYRMSEPSKIEQRWLAIGSLLLLTYIVLLIVELTFVFSKVDRFLLIVFPAINILSAIGFVILLNWLGQYIRRPVSVRSWLFGGSMALIGGIQLAVTLPAHPYYFTYWNPWVGGGRAAMNTVPMGAGEGIDLAVNYLNNQPDASKIVFVCGASQPWCSRIFKGETFRSATYFSGEWVRADYVSSYISHLQRGSYPPEIVDFFERQTPVYQVDLQGVTYARVYAVPKIAHFAGIWNVLTGLGQLLGYNLSPAQSGGTGGQAGDTIEATIWWVNLGSGVDNLILRWVDETGYEWGRAKVVPKPEYTSIAPEQRAVVAGTASLTIPPGTPPGTYFLRIGVVEPGTERLLGEFKMPGEANKLVVSSGRIFSDPALFAITNPVNQLLAPALTLLGYDPPPQVLTAHSPTWLTLYWQAVAQPPNYIVALRLLDEEGREAARWKNQPGGGHYPTNKWQAGEIVRDVWALQVEPETPLGLYSLEISLLDADSPEAQGLSSDLSRTRGFKIQDIEVWPQPIHYETPEMQAELRASFGDRLTLLGYDLYFDTDGSGRSALSPTFYWQSQTDMQAAFDLVLTLQAADTNQLVKEWRVPLGVDGRKTLWKADEVVNTTYQLDTGIISQEGYHLTIALQSLANDQLEPVKLENGPETNFVKIENIQDKIVVRVVD